MVSDSDGAKLWDIPEILPEKPFSKLFVQTLNKSQQKKVLSYRETCKKEEKGPRWNTEKFYKLKGDIFEMRPTKQVRLLGFFHPNKRKTFVIANAIIKKQNRVPPKEIEKAQRARDRFIST